MGAGDGMAVALSLPVSSACIPSIEHGDVAVRFSAPPDVSDQRGGEGGGARTTQSAPTSPLEVTIFDVKMGGADIGTANSI